MTDTDVDVLALRALCCDAAAGIEGIATELIGLFDGWQANGAPPASLEWLADVIGRLGFWNGRFTSTAASMSPGGAHQRGY
jgi:hypothetical protein